MNRNDYLLIIGTIGFFSVTLLYILNKKSEIALQMQTYKNNEEWEILRDSEGNLTKIKVLRNAKINSLLNDENYEQ